MLGLTWPNCCAAACSCRRATGSFFYVVVHDCYTVCIMLLGTGGVYCVCVQVVYTARTPQVHSPRRDRRQSDVLLFRIALLYPVPRFSPAAERIGAKGSGGDGGDVDAGFAIIMGRVFVQAATVLSAIRGWRQDGQSRKIDEGS